MALGLHEHVQDEAKERQGSAPITKQEKDSHHKRLSSTEQESLSEATPNSRTLNLLSPDHSKHSNSSKHSSTRKTAV